MTPAMVYERTSIRGRLRVTVVPCPRAESIVTAPPASRAKRSTMARPRPLPAPLGRVLKNGSAARAHSSGRHTRPRIGYRQTNLIRREPAAQGDAALAAGRRVRIVQQFEQRQLKLGWIAKHQVRAFGEITYHHPRLFAHQLDDIARQGVHRHRHRLLRGAAGEDQQALREVGGAPGSVARTLQIAIQFRLRRCAWRGSASAQGCRVFRSAGC